MENNSVNNLTNKELGLSYWYVTHKLLLRQILILAMSVVGFLLLFFVVWQLSFWGINYANESFQVRKLIFTDNLGLGTIESQKPVSLQISDPISLKGEGGRDDYFSQVSNNNIEWLATFDYQFNNDTDNTRYRRGFSLPNSQKFLMDLGVEQRISGLDIINLKWQRLPDSARLYDERHRFSIENEDFIAGAQLGDPNRLVFDITNHSAYSYWEVGIQSFLYSDGNIASVNYLAIEQLMAGETRHIELSWSNRLPRINSLDIIPDINVFDEENIMPQRAETDVPIFQ